MAEVVLCIKGCGHDHNAVNGPSGCCKEHGPYLYFCPDCHDAWAAANPDAVARVRRALPKAAKALHRATATSRAPHAWPTRTVCGYPRHADGTCSNGHPAQPNGRRAS